MPISMDQSFQGLKAVLFDFGGTLDADGLTWRQQFYPIYRRMGFDWSLEEFNSLFYFADDALTERGLKNFSFQRTVRLQVSLLLEKAGRLDKRIADKIVRAYARESQSHLERNKPTL